MYTDRVGSCQTQHTIVNFLCKLCFNIFKVVFESTMGSFPTSNTERTKRFVCIQAKKNKVQSKDQILISS